MQKDNTGKCCFSAVTWIFLCFQIEMDISPQYLFHLYEQTKNYFLPIKIFYAAMKRHCFIDLEALSFFVLKIKANTYALYNRNICIKCMQEGGDDYMKKQNSVSTKHIKRFYPKDERFFKVLAAAGNIKSKDANRIDISDTRLKNMLKDSIIKEVSLVNPKHKEIESEKCYCFTEKGKQFVKDNFNINRTQSPASARHNCKTAEVICSLQKREIDSIQPEWEVRSQMMEAVDSLRLQGETDRYNEYMEMLQNRQISAIDFTYTNMQGVQCGVEITTGYYKDADLDGKAACSELISVPVEYVPA